MFCKQKKNQSYLTLIDNLKISSLKNRMQHYDTYYKADIYITFPALSVSLKDSVSFVITRLSDDEVVLSLSHIFQTQTIQNSGLPPISVYNRGT